MVENLAPPVVAERMKRGSEEVVLLDVREGFERRVASISPSLHIPMNEVPDRLDEIPRDRLLVVYCHSGERSMLVAGFLAGRGYRSVANLAGGIDAWSALVDPDVPRYY